MRCKACNAELTDAESTAQDEHGFIDLCSYCLTKIRLAEETELGQDYSVRYRDGLIPFDYLDG